MYLELPPAHDVKLSCVPFWYNLHSVVQTSLHLNLNVNDVLLLCTSGVLYKDSIGAVRSEMEHGHWVMSFLTFTTLWANSEDNKLNILFILFFQENRIWHSGMGVGEGGNLWVIMVRVCEPVFRNLPHSYTRLWKITNPFIYMYLIVQNVDVLIYCPLIFLYQVIAGN